MASVLHLNTCIEYNTLAVRVQSLDLGLEKYFQLYSSQPWQLQSACRSQPRSLAGKAGQRALKVFEVSSVLLSFVESDIIVFAISSAINELDRLESFHGYF